MKSTEIVHGEDLCTAAKACKTKAEIKGAKAAHLRDGAALCRFLCWLDAYGRTGKISEIDAARKAEAFRAETGKLRDLSFDTISGSGPNGAIVHYRVTHATNRRLRPGDLYLIDSGGQYADGTTDVTRTVLIEGRPPPEVQLMHLRAFYAATLRWPPRVFRPVQTACNWTRLPARHYGRRGRLSTMAPAMVSAVIFPCMKVHNAFQRAGW